jgi:multimeric flavodoxin WrbA
LKIIGFSSGRTGRESNIDRLVKTVLDNSRSETEFVKLTDLHYSGCKGCVQLCAKPQVCILDDDLKPYYQKMKELDAIVLGSPVYFGSVNAAMLAFVERFFGYRHVTIAIKNKPFILALSGGGRNLAPAVQQFRKVLEPFRVNILDCVTYSSGIPPCFSCGRHQECHIGGMYGALGEAALTTTIRSEMFRRWEDRPDTCAALASAMAKLKALQSVSGPE